MNLNPCFARFLVFTIDNADNIAFFGKPGAESDYDNIFKMAQEMYREERLPWLTLFCPG